MNYYTIHPTQYSILTEILNTHINQNLYIYSIAHLIYGNNHFIHKKKTCNHFIHKKKLTITFTTGHNKSCFNF